MAEVKLYPVTINGIEYEFNATSPEQAKEFALNAWREEMKQLPAKSSLEMSRDMGGATPTQGMNPPTPSPDLAQSALATGKSFANELGVLGRAGIEGATGLVGPLVNPVFQAINPGASFEGGMGELLDVAGLPRAETSAQKIASMGIQGLSGGGAMVGLGKAISGDFMRFVRDTIADPKEASKLLETFTKFVPTLEKNYGAALAAQPIAQMAGGLAGGLGSEASGQVAQSLGASPEVEQAARLAGGLGGGVVGAGTAGLQKVPTGRTPELIEQADRAGVSLMTSDVLPPKTFASKWLQATSEKIPFAGTGGMRRDQNEQRIDAIKGLLEDFGADDVDTATTAVMKDLSAKRSADLDKWTKAKGEVIENPNLTGQVPTPSTVKAIDDQIAKLESLKTKEVAPIIDRLKDWKDSIQGQNLQNVETLRKQIGESFKAPELASVRSTGEKALSSIYGALKDDMGNYIKTNGEKSDYAKWMVANKQLADMAGELKNNALSSVLKNGKATPEVVNRMLFSQKPSEIETLYRNLPPEGRANARAAILAKAAEKAGENVSPEKFVNEVNRLGKSVGVFFSGDDLKQVEGLVRVLNTTRRAGQAAVAPPTGVQVAIPTGAAALASMFGGGLTGFIGAMAAGAGVGGLSRIYESKAVRDILMKIPYTVKGSKEEAAMAKRFASLVSTQPEKTASDRVKESK